MMLKKEILTGIDINAGPPRIWEVLTDFPSYPEWNPTIRHAGGELEPGKRLELTFEPAGKKERSFRPRLLVVEPDRELRWLGSPGFPKLLESQHYFIIERRPDESAHLLHGMVFYGLLVPLLYRRLEASTRGPFEDMNRALKGRAELKPVGAF